MDRLSMHSLNHLAELAHVCVFEEGGVLHELEERLDVVTRDAAATPAADRVRCVACHVCAATARLLLLGEESYRRFDALLVLLSSVSSASMSAMTPIGSRPCRGSRA